LAGNRFAGKTIVITGAGSGLGRECALQWSAEGGHVVVTDVSEPRARAVVQTIQEGGGDALAMKVDVSVESEVEAAVDAAIQRYGAVDIMFANAGRTITGRRRLEEVTEEEWDYVNDVVFKGVFFSAKHACIAMKERGGGNIIVTISAAAITAYPIGFSPYSAGKAGALGLVKALAVEWGKYGIRVNGLAPTHGMSVNFGLPLDAPVLNLSYEEFALKKSGASWEPQMFVGPLKIDRPPMIRDNAAVATFLASDDSAYMSGVVIPSCDGGSFAVTSIPFPDDWTLEGLISGTDDS
jgi:NAD(P)-dependent dehydrogenase (short-subunit alcohol dehydrogenase family)